MNPRPGIKKHQLQGQMLQDLNSFLRFSLNDPRLQFVSVTRVELVEDNSRAIVYWDTFDSRTHPQAARAMGKAAGRLRTLLARKLKKKTVPKLTVRYDEQFEQEQRMVELLNSSSPHHSQPPVNH